MAVVGDAITPHVQGPPDLIEAFPFGDLITLVDTYEDQGVVEMIANRFPTPPVIGSFLIVVDFEMEYQGLDSPYLIVGALYPESDYLEPTTGQIWPR